MKLKELLKLIDPLSLVKICDGSFYKETLRMKIDDERLNSYLEYDVLTIFAQNKDWFQIVVTEPRKKILNRYYSGTTKHDWFCPNCGNTLVEFKNKVETVRRIDECPYCNQKLIMPGGKDEKKN